MARAAGEPGRRHLVLLGLPGAGKSTIGPLVASALGWRFVDLDEALRSQTGESSVAAIFSRHGEGRFRALERALTASLLAEDRRLVVLSPGSGWVEDPENRAWLGATADAVYLRVSEAVALERMGPAVTARPLLAGPDPTAKIAELLARREPYYLQARYTLSNDSITAQQAASSIVALAMAKLRD